MKLKTALTLVNITPNTITKHRYDVFCMELRYNIMKYNLSRQISKAKAKKYFNRLLEAGKMIELKEVKPVRSNQQNRYAHLLFNYVSIETGYTLEEVKQCLFKTMGKNISIFSRKTKLGVYLRSTSDLDSREMAEALENFRLFCATTLQLILPLPNETQFLMEIEEIIEYEKVNM